MALFLKLTASPCVYMEGQGAEQQNLSRYRAEQASVSTEMTLKSETTCKGGAGKEVGYNVACRRSTKRQLK